MCGLYRYAEVALRRGITEPDDFIESQCNSELEAAVAGEYRDAAAAAGRPFVPVYLRLSREENARKIASRSRVTSGTGKLVDPGVLLAIRDSCDLFEFSDVEGLHLDVTEIDAEEASRRIYQYVRPLLWRHIS
jgi:hypothetical protein